MTISRLRKVPLRDLWKHEAHDFSRWLGENLDYLSEILGLDLNLIELEASGDMSFAADLTAEDGDGNYFIIENQLEKTDHDHLGKIITYMSNLEAKSAIWITSEPRPEHEKAIHWLNEMLPPDSAVFLVRLEAYKIDNSNHAPLFTIIAGPTSIGKKVGEEKKELAKRHVLRISFWEQLSQKFQNELPMFRNITGGKANWISASSGCRGLIYNFVIRMDSARVELYIDTGNGRENKRIYDEIYNDKENIETSFGEPLDWQRRDDHQASKIAYTLKDYGLLDKDQWSTLQDKMIDSMRRLSNALEPALKNIQ